MNYKLTLLLSVCVAFIGKPSFAQIQSCPSNINFSTGDLSFWGAKTGLVGGASQSYPAPNPGVTVIPEYSISATGVRVITAATADLYGGFTTIPTINGYTYNYSVLVGSTATSFDLNSAAGGNPGGFTRAITYTINVPAGSSAIPYTMTYAYAMVLENGTHNSNEQPLFKATLSTKDSIITCASPKYYLPTLNNTTASGSGATLDTAAAIANGFTNSPVPFLSHAGVAGGGGTLLQDVWTKDWTEVTFDLSPYRGQQVSITFEADNCTPGAHFAYAYVALRNTCAGLQISGDSVACANTKLTYSVPSLTNGAYTWVVPAGWVINSGANTNIITVTPTSIGGNIIAREINGCADLRDTIDVTSKPPTIPGAVISDNTVCSGINSTSLTLNGQAGNVLGWVYSTDGTSWSGIVDTTNNYTAQNLGMTTQYKAVVQNGAACSIDSSTAAIITVNPQSIGGTLNPDDLNFCAGQNTASLLTLTGNTGSVVNWQTSTDNTNWNSFIPVDTDSTYNVNAINTTTYYRTIVKSGVCPADTSTVATINFINIPFPVATINPPVSSICFGASATLNANITTGTSYLWNPSNTISTPASGTIGSLPYNLVTTASPSITTDYVLSIINAGCPNALSDTFHVMVAPKIVVFAGRDTSVVVGQPLQFNATASDPNANLFNWSPATGLNFTNIYNPIGIYNAEMGDYITYVVTATNPAGCSGANTVTVRIFKTGADIFVPSAFTPNGDGKNDIMRPICVGIKQLNYFRIYNRWGQLVYSTSQIEQGWDGKISGTPQSTASFVYIAEGIDYTGKTIFRKGTFTLIR